MAERMSSSNPAEHKVYYIKNKDKVLATFIWEPNNERVILAEHTNLPYFILKSPTDWVKTRTPPKHREHMVELLQLCNLTTTKSIIDYSKGLSLNDTLWVTSNVNDAWDNVNLYDNDFDEVIARIAFDGSMQGLPFSTTSPEFGTNGMLPKCWIRDSRQNINLMKGGTSDFSNTGNEPFSEVMTAQMLRVLRYPHVEYHLEKFHGKLVSVCSLFTSQEEMYIPVYQYYNFWGFDGLFDAMVADGFAEGLAQILVTDYLIFNTDRHAGNFGLLLDADTFEPKALAPIFDNGAAMLAYWNGRDNIDEYIQDKPPQLYSDFEYGARLGKGILGSKHNVQKLINFKFDRSELPGCPEGRVSAVESFLQQRVRAFLQM